jgi:hypothetical protein
MNRGYKLLLALCLIMLIQPFFAQTVKFLLSPDVLKPGEKGVIKATLTIPEGKKQTVNPKNPNISI